jgi:hypothetical protein
MTMCSKKFPTNGASEILFNNNSFSFTFQESFCKLEIMYIELEKFWNWLEYYDYLFIWIFMFDQL